MEAVFWGPEWTYWMAGHRGSGGPGGSGRPGWDKSWRKGFWQDFMGEPGQRADRGVVRYLVLDAISHQPRHGYDIMQSISEKSRGTYKPSPGVIYPTLQMLEELGHTRSIEADGRKVFQITDAGREELAEHRDEVEDFYERTSGAGDWEEQAEMFSDLAAGVSQLFRLYKRASRRGSLSSAAKKAIRAELADALERIEKIIERD